MADLVMKSYAQATNLLLDHGINPIIWGDQALVSWGYPTVICVYDFAIEDSRLEEAMGLLKTHTNFKVVDPSLAAKAKGILGLSGYHLVSEADKKMWPTRMHLLPQSLVHLSSYDTELVKSPFDPNRNLLQPELQQYCISLVKCMEDYSATSANRIPAEHALLALLATAVCKIPNIGGKIWVPEEFIESEEDFQVRQSAAIREIEKWEVAEDDEVYRQKVIKYFLSKSID
ncbi:hypothetical protein H072_899 [Dactylellina haptotyla CBS 200.50]|uniref:Uncharacterized protein n=1 Tax=Dactylellina haptotyla (strain CBS 200.50) TaxID=1284197 RepID=S8C044_DACHA|nr:hypothetical protein H072_899 [Dactylellina haptotyla CBS 200.50]